jgi:hypothetical protein
MLRASNSHQNTNIAGDGAFQYQGQEINNGSKIGVDDLMRLLKRLFPSKTEHSFTKLAKVVLFFCCFSCLNWFYLC